MSWGSWILIFIYPVTLLFGMAGLTRKEAQRVSQWPPLKALSLGALLLWGYEKARAGHQGLGRLSIAFGIGLGIYTGILLGTLGARPLWSSAILGPLFLVSGISTGAAVMMLFPLSKEEHHSLLRWDVLAIGVEICLIGLFFLDLASGNESGRQAAAMLLGGDYTALFWSLVVITGLIVPFLIEVLESRRHLRPTLFAPMLLLTGGFCLRWILVTAGQA